MIEKPKGKKVYKTIDFLHQHIVGVIIIVVIIACGLSMLYYVNDKTKSKNHANENVEYVNTDTVFFAIHNLKVLNPLTSTDDDVYYINQLIYSSLFKLDDTLNVEEDLVESYSTNKGEGVVSIVLKSGVQFSDGTKLTTDDIKYTIDRIQDIGSSSPYYNYAAKISGVTITSDRKMDIEFANPANAAVDNLVFPIVSSNNYGVDEDNYSLGSGQYKFSSYDKTNVLKLKPNSNYYGTIAKNKIQLKVLPKISATTGLMTMDSITAYVNTAKDADSDAEDKGLKAVSISSNEVEYLAYNYKNKYLAIKDVRKAIATSINTDSLVKDNYGGVATTSDSIYFPGFLGTKNKGDSYPVNQSETSKLLKAQGYEDLDEDGLLEDVDRNKLSFTLIVNSNDTSRSDVAGDIAESLKSVGLDITVKKLSWNNYVAALENGNFDLALCGYKFDKQYDLRDLFNSKNTIGFYNEKILESVNKLETAIDDKEQKSTYETLKEQLKDELPYYCLCYKTYSFVTVKTLEGDVLPTFFDRYRGVSTWKWEKTVSEDTASDTYKTN